MTADLIQFSGAQSTGGVVNCKYDGFNRHLSLESGLRPGAWLQRYIYVACEAKKDADDCELLKRARASAAAGKPLEAVRWLKLLGEKVGDLSLVGSVGGNPVYLVENPRSLNCVVGYFKDAKRWLWLICSKGAKDDTTCELRATKKVYGNL